jgi:hypothetical protein
VDARLKRGIQTVAMYHMNFSRESDSSYRLLEGRYYELPADYEHLAAVGYRELARMVLLGSGYFLVVPVPLLGQARGFLPAAAMPQMLLWYGVLGLSAIGVWSLLRTRWRAACLVLAIAAGLTVTLAISGGNIGTTFRHRDLVTPLYFLFAAVGAQRLWPARGRPA